jgi:large subunit ribosomal protein L9
MKIILRKDIEKLGKIGDVLNVKNGYARNYLLPKEFAFVAKEGAIRRIELATKNRLNTTDKAKEDAMALAARINDLQISIPMKVGEGNKLYASVNAQLIANKVAELGYNIDKNNIILDESIKTLGVFDVKIKIYADIVAGIKV